MGCGTVLELLKDLLDDGRVGLEGRADLVKVLGEGQMRKQGLSGQHTCMFSMHIAVMALTLVGVTPGAFNVWSDCKSDSNSSMAAMFIFSVSDQSDERKENSDGYVQVIAECVVQAPRRQTRRLYSTLLARAVMKQSRLYDGCYMNRQLIE